MKSMKITQDGRKTVLKHLKQELVNLLKVCWRMQTEIETVSSLTDSQFARCRDSEIRENAKIASLDERLARYASLSWTKTAHSLIGSKNLPKSDNTLCSLVVVPLETLSPLL